MIDISHAATVVRLRDEYSVGARCVSEPLVVNVEQPIQNHGFMGSFNVVSLASLETIIHEAPACIAAPVVNMLAIDAIALGADGHENLPVPVRLYAPKQLSIATRHLFVGDVEFLVEPEDGVVDCKKLTLVKSTVEEPDYFEAVKSWVTNDGVELEIISLV